MHPAVAILVVPDDTRNLQLQFCPSPFEINAILRGCVGFPDIKSDVNCLTLFDLAGITRQGRDGKISPLKTFNENIT